MSSLTVRGRTARQAGQTVAFLTFAGRLVTVRAPGDKVIGRLIRQNDTQPYRYDVWTALHEATMTPSDRLLVSYQPIEDAVEQVLQAQEVA
jgi:hypothetical protein